MSEQSVHILLYLSQHKSINNSTIQSLINYGFDSDESLISLDFQLDLPQITDISSDQKLVLKEALSQFKSNIRNYNNIYLEQDFSQIYSTLKTIKSLIDVKFASLVDRLRESLVSVEKQNHQKQISINKCLIELNTKEKVIDNFNSELSAAKQLIKILENKLENQFCLHQNNLKQLKACLLKSDGANINQNHPKRDHIKPFHTSVNRLECVYDQCNQSFASLNNLKRHILTVHNKVKQFKCTFHECGKVFGRKDTLNKHLKISHKNGII